MRTRTRIHSKELAHGFAFAIAIASSFASACTFNSGVPEDAHIQCTSTGDCPDGMRCADVLGECVLLDRDDDTPPGLVNAIMGPERLGSADTLTVVFGTNEPLATSPQLEVGGVPVDVVAQEDGTFFGEIAASALGSGPKAGVVLLVDRAGNAGVALLDVVDVDVDAPFVLAPPAATIVVLDKNGLGSGPLLVGGEVVVSFEIEERGSAFVDLAARRVTDENGLAVAPTEDIALENLGAIGRQFQFRLSFSTSLAPGTYSFVVTTRDDVGNTATSTLQELATIDDGNAEDGDGDGGDNGGGDGGDGGDGDPTEGGGIAPVPTQTIDATVFVAPFAPSTCVALTSGEVIVCADADGDGFFGAGGTCPEADDCDDTDPTVRPSMPDAPGDAIDDGCRGAPLVLNDATAVFAAPPSADGAPSGGGTQASPMNDVRSALLLAASRGVPLVMQAGTYDVGNGQLVASTSVFGGYDETWTRPASDAENTAVTPRSILLATNADRDVLVFDDTTSEIRLDRVAIEGSWCDGTRADGIDGTFFMTTTRLRGEQSAFGCNDAFRVGVNSQRELYAARVSVRRELPGGAASTDDFFYGMHGNNARLSARLVETDIVIDVPDGYAFGIEPHGSVSVVRSRIVTRGFISRGIAAHDDAAGDVAVIASSFDVTALGAQQFDETNAIRFPGRLLLSQSTVRLNSFAEEDAALRGPDAEVIASILDVEGGAAALDVFAAFTLRDVAVRGCLAHDASPCTPAPNDIAAACGSAPLSLELCEDATGSFGVNDPLYKEDGYHLAVESPLRDRATLPVTAETNEDIAHVALASGVMDLDGECRGAIVEPGVDELP